MQAAELKNLGIDPLILANIGLAVPNAFKVQASINVKLLKVQKADPTHKSDIDISALLGMNSPTLAGSLGICFPAKTFLNVVNKMLGEKFEAVTPEIADAASELLNIIYGQARTKINEAGHQFSPAIPSVVLGKEIQMAHGGGMNVVNIQCTSDEGPFMVELGLKVMG